MGTSVVHSGWTPETNNPHILPIYQTGTFTFKSVAEAKRAFEKGDRFVYTRFNNPNFRQLEEKIASLEGTGDALIFPCGLSAIHSTLLEVLLGKKGQLICTKTLYGGTDELFSKQFPRFGIKVNFVDTTVYEDVETAIEKAFREGAKAIAVFLETPANPTLSISDIRMISKVISCHDENMEIPLVVDNSFATPYNQRPLFLGADIIVHSVTKYLNGHGDLIEGAVAGSNKFIRKYLQLWRNVMGINPSPYECWLADRGLETFVLRMEKHNSNAAKLAEFLENHPLVERVLYPGLKSHPQHGIALRQMRTPNGENGFGGMISFELKGEVGTTEKFLNYFPRHKSFVTLSVSLGYTSTLIESPALMTHSALPREERLKKGITDKLVRLSVGIEDYQDLEDEFAKALAYINR
ncbi:MAG: aminotransferase class I/II-fold pyridoxal phosphate-dependent enzyme [Candidatus Nealsonbacteria bacterium]|nr:aminotransferase class I/II-fold pyridoxal phosphate-dependent enzyme [Candidatus Nealsonbacteria bacterium]